LFAASGIKVGNIDEDGNKRLPLYFTNAILGAKTEGGMAGAVKRSWYKDTAEQFTKPLIDLVQPKVIVTMGAIAYDLVSMVYGLPKQKMKDAIESGPKKLSDGMLWHVAAHCSGLGLVNRKFAQQQADWARMNLQHYL
jgi:uracil-DNA glycosylase